MVYDNPTTPVGAAELAATLASIDARLGALGTQVAYLVERQRRVEELVDEMTPIARAMMDAGGEKLGAMEQKGWFTFGREAWRVLERVVESYGEDDVRQLGDNVVQILDTVRNLTQSDVLAMANEATDALHEADQSEPMSVLGVMKASRDEDVQRGMAVAMGVLRRIGRASRETEPRPLARRAPPQRHAAKAKGLSDRLAPRRAAPAAAEGPKVAPSTLKAAAGPACAPSVVPVENISIPGYALEANGALSDQQAWTRDFAVAMGAALGAPALTEAHFALLEAARADYQKMGVSPNIRRLSAVAGLSTKEIYALFPKAPGKTTSRLAGIPKPAGCI